MVFFFSSLVFYCGCGCACVCSIQLLLSHTTGEILLVCCEYEIRILLLIFDYHKLMTWPNSDTHTTRIGHFPQRHLSASENEKPQEIYTEERIYVQHIGTRFVVLLLLWMLNSMPSCRLPINYFTILFFIGCCYGGRLFFYFLLVTSYFSLVIRRALT